MKKIIALTLAAGLLLAGFVCRATTVVHGDDSRITYIGRTLHKDGATVFNWSGVTLIVSFEGTSLTIDAEDSSADSFNLWIDSQMSPVADKVLSLNGHVTVADKLKKGPHTVILQKRTEGEQGTTKIKTLTTDGKLVQARPLKERRIEFIGDSYTCGYGTESHDRSDPFRPETENCNQAYGFIAGRYFDADVQLVSHSGRGIIRNYDDFNPELTMTNMYSWALDGCGEFLWKRDGFKPDIVVIYLGTNDFSCGKQPDIQSWCGNYRILLEKARALHPGVPVLCVASKSNPLMGQYVREAVEKSGISGVHWTAIQEMAHNSTTELGASWHPNYEGQRKVACCVIPYISTITGWGMPLKPIE